MIRYINCKTEFGIETIDELHSKEYANNKVFWKVLLNTLEDAQISGHKAYISIRASKEWYNR